MERLVVLAAAALLAGCAGGESDESPVTLYNRASPQTLPVELEGVDRSAVLTSVRVLPVASLGHGSPADNCLRQRFAGLEAEGSTVVRVGVHSETATFEEHGGSAVFGCSNTAGPREEDRRWCGGAYGNVVNGRLADPRLDIGCQTESGTQVGFVWIEPAEDTRFVVVDQPEYSEVYEVAAGMPVRIATVSGVDTETSSASFDVSEHDADGRLIEEYELEAFVAG